MRFLQIDGFKRKRPAGPTASATLAFTGFLIEQGTLDGFEGQFQAKTGLAQRQVVILSYVTYS